jgi:hypothetical protein
MTVTKRKQHSRGNEEKQGISFSPGRISISISVRDSRLCIAVTDSGVRYTCDACSADISHTVRIRCAQLVPPASPAAPPRNVTGPPSDQDRTADPDKKGWVNVCEDFDLCGTCFCEGKEIARHKTWHDYRVIVREPW